MKCLLFHKWKDTSVPVQGRRNIDHYNEQGQLCIEQGPEETFYPNPEGPIYPTRECTKCHKRQFQYGARWI